MHQKFLSRGSSSSKAKAFKVCGARAVECKSHPGNHKQAQLDSPWRFWMKRLKSLPGAQTPTHKQVPDHKENTGTSWGAKSQNIRGGLDSLITHSSFNWKSWDTERRSRSTAGRAGPEPRTLQPQSRSRATCPRLRHFNLAVLTSASWNWKAWLQCPNSDKPKA